MSDSPTWSDGLMSALLNPGVQALAGAAGGFAQAAMPSRLPVPTGAALGMGAAGALQGVQNAQRGQLAQQQIQAAQIGNQRSQLGLDWYKQMMGGMAGNMPGSGAGGNSAATDPNAPAASASDGPVTSSSAPAGSLSIRGKQITDDNGRYLVSPQQLVQMGNMSFAMGDPGAAAAFYGHAQSSAGGAGYAFGQNGQAFAVPGGAQDPGVIATKSAAEKGGALPATLAEQGFMMGPNGTLVPIPGGKADPNYMRGSAAATTAGTKGAEAPYVPPQEYTVPVTDGNGAPVLDAQGRPTFRKQIMSPPQANAAVSSGATNPSYADPFPGWAAKINGTENATGNPAAPNASGPGGTPTSTAMGNGQFLDGTWPSVIRAARPDLAAGKSDAELLPLRAVPGLAQSATEQYARMNGASLAQAGLPVNGGTMAMAHMLGPGGAATVLRANDNAPLAMLPGMAPVVQANPSLRGMTAGQLRQQFATQMGAAPQLPGLAGTPALTPQQMPYDLRQGGMHVDPTAASVVKNPEPVKIVTPGGATIEGHMNPASPFAPEGTPGTFAPVQVTPNPAAAAGASTAPAGTPAAGSVATSALPPDVIEGREELTKGLFGKDTDSYVAANNTQGWLNQINHAADVMNKAGPLYQTGPYAETRTSLMSGINDVARTLNLPTLFDQNVLASPEELRKATTTAGFELSSHYEGHARQAAATIMNATSAVPGMSNSPQGIVLVSNGINEGAQSAIDMHNYKMDRYSGQDPYGVSSAPGTKAGAGLESAETDFVKAFPAAMYSSRAISTVQPIKISGPGDFDKYLPGTVVVAPNGARGMVPPRPNAPPIPNYLRSYIQPQGAPNAAP